MIFSCGNKLYAKYKFNLAPLVLVLVFALYYVGLNGGYVFDDTHVLVKNSLVKITELGFSELIEAANSFGPGGRQISMASFALNYYAFGDSTWWLKFFNLLIHCLNGVGLWILTSKICEVMQSSRIQPNRTYDYLPLVVSALWLLHPINLIPVLYISQRMALLSTFFIIYGLILYVVVRSKTRSNSGRLLKIPLVIIIFTLLAFFSKENGALLPVYAALLELVVFRFTTDGRVDKIVLSLFVSGLVCVVGVITYKFIQNPHWIVSGYRWRVFTLEERVLTQFRALGTYIYQIVLPSNNFLSIVHDDFALSRSLLKPVSTLYALLFLLFLLGVAVFSFFRKQMFLSLGIFWFFVSHLIESTIIPLEIMHEHRNYLASFGIILVISAMLIELTGQRKKALFILFLVFGAGYSTVLLARATLWSNDMARVEHEARKHPSSAAAVFRLGTRYYQAAFNGSPDKALKSQQLLERARINDEFGIGPELLLVLLSEHPVVQYKGEWIASATEKIKKYPYFAPSKAALEGLVRCLRNKECTPSRVDDLDLLFSAAVEHGGPKMITDAAEYFFSVKGDVEVAEAAYKKALRGRRVVNWVNYIGLLVASDQPLAACKAYNDFLDAAEKGLKGRLSAHRSSISAMEQELQYCSNESS